MERKFGIVVAADQNRCIGKDQTLPWNLPGDMRRFRELTTKSRHPNLLNALIMGRRTWESLPEKSRPLAKRINIVLTRQADYEVPMNVYVASSFGAALEII